MTEKKSFVLYSDQEETFKSLTDRQAGQLIKAIFDYHRGKEVKLGKTLTLVFIPFKQTFERDLIKWENICKRNTENIKKRYLPKSTSSTSGRFGLPNAVDSDSDSDSEKLAASTEQKQNINLSPAIANGKSSAALEWAKKEYKRRISTGELDPVSVKNEKAYISKIARDYKTPEELGYYDFADFDK